MYYEIKNSKCPKCGCEEIGAGYASGYAALANVKHLFRNSGIVHEVCTKCGYVIDSYVMSPERFK